MRSKRRFTRCDLRTNELPPESGPVVVRVPMLQDGARRARSAAFAFTSFRNCRTLTALRRQDQLGPARDDYTPLKREEPLIHERRSRTPPCPLRPPRIGARKLISRKVSVYRRSKSIHLTSATSQVTKRGLLATKHAGGHAPSITSRPLITRSCDIHD